MYDLEGETGTDFGIVVQVKFAYLRFMTFRWLIDIFKLDNL